MNWFGWALASAAFAALTAIFGKIGVSGIQSDYATFLRTLVILMLIAGIVSVGGHWRSPAELPGRSLAFLTLFGLATGAFWLCYGVRTRDHMIESSGRTLRKSTLKAETQKYLTFSIDLNNSRFRFSVAE